jgi:hypothetical protein
VHNGHQISLKSYVTVSFTTCAAGLYHVCLCTASLPKVNVILHLSPSRTQHLSFHHDSMSVAGWFISVGSYRIIWIAFQLSVFTFGTILDRWTTTPMMQPGKDRIPNPSHASCFILIILRIWCIQLLRAGWQQKNVHFVKLSKIRDQLPLRSSRRDGQKNIYGTFNLESGWESYASEKIYKLPVRADLAQIWTTGPRPVLPVAGRERHNFAWKWTTGTTGPWPVLPVGTGTTGGPWPVVPVGVYSESDFQISNRFVSRSVFGRGKPRK